MAMALCSAICALRARTARSCAFRTTSVYLRSTLPSTSCSSQSMPSVNDKWELG
ncbi:hypothetical protein DIPPA_03326 [Diplonema papillatum]|nr:hypothetical protein DIPPA_31594 [Diplonema papillatum]KAJ9441649.1 hypothetical protein DIPPA_03326 [Diplonema papillatum]